MEKTVCKYNNDGVCRSAHSPMFDKACPVAETFNVCKYEHLVTVEYIQTPLGCMLDACKKIVPTMSREQAVEIMNEFIALMKANGYSTLPEPHILNKEADVEVKCGAYNVGDRVCYDDISDSDDWMFDSVSHHTEYPTVTYVTLDNTLTVSFENGSEYGTIMLNR